MADCQKCLLRNFEKSYEACNTETGISWFFDVQIAEQIISTGIVPLFTVPLDMLQSTLSINDVDPQHLDHVDMTAPLIYGMLLPEPKPPSAIVMTDGEIDIYILPLDGSHRAARAIRDEMPVTAFMLTPEQTMSCLVAVEDRQKETFSITQSALEKSTRLAREAGLL